MLPEEDSIQTLRRLCKVTDLANCNDIVAEAVAEYLDCCLVLWRIRQTENTDKAYRNDDQSNPDFEQKRMSHFFEARKTLNFKNQQDQLTINMLWHKV